MTEQDIVSSSTGVRWTEISGFPIVGDDVEAALAAAMVESTRATSDDVNS